MKRYFAIVGAICAVSLTVVVALRIAPEAWAVIAGILFGGLASLPMGFIALMLLRRQPVAPVAQQPVYQQPQVIIVREPALPRRQQQYHIPAAQQAPQYQDEEYIEGDYYEYDEPAAAPRPAYGTHIVNQQPTSVRVIGGRR